LGSPLSLTAKIAQAIRQASAQDEREYAETAAALADKKELSDEVNKLWRKARKPLMPTASRTN
jgi:hypothetical protein